MRVLCVEDDVATAKGVELMCQMAGHSCDITGLGEQAIELAKQNAYDVIVLDMMLPDIDGYQVIGRLRTAGVHTPFLIQSGLVDRDKQFEDDLFGGNEYLVKPFTSSELIDRMRIVLSSAAQEVSPFTENEPIAPEPPSRQEEERRRHRRFSTLKEGELILAESRQPVACLILNLSYGGAEIRLPEKEFDCPETFALKLRSGPVHSCEVRWRRSDRIGVEFT
jgi:two-component system cell cycle response regulator CtrA